jgi:hypothetical protein
MRNSIHSISLVRKWQIAFVYFKWFWTDIFINAKRAKGEDLVGTHYQVKFFNDVGTYGLEKDINRFLEELAAEKCEVHDIKCFKTSVYNPDEGRFYTDYTAMVIFKWDDKDIMKDIADYAAMVILKCEDEDTMKDKAKAVSIKRHSF